MLVFEGWLQRLLMDHKGWCERQITMEAFSEQLTRHDMYPMPSLSWHVQPVPPTQPCQHTAMPAISGTQHPSQRVPGSVISKVTSQNGVCAPAPRGLHRWTMGQMKKWKTAGNNLFSETKCSDSQAVSHNSTYQHEYFPLLRHYWTLYHKKIFSCPSFSSFAHLATPRWVCKHSYSVRSNLRYAIKIFLSKATQHISSKVYIYHITRYTYKDMQDKEA